MVGRLSARVRGTIGRILLAASALGALGALARAQSSLDAGKPAESKGGTSTASSYAPDKLETVNLANGNLSINLPLTTVGGRGTATFTIALAYNSKLWSTEHEATENPHFDLEPVTYTHHYYARYDQDSASSPDGVALGGGWRLSLGPALRTRRVNIGPDKCSGTSNSRDTCYQWTLTKMWLTLPDGSEVELRDQYTQGAPHYLGGQFAGVPDRWRGRVWVTTDGSAATFVSDADNGAVNDQLAGWVFLADGTRLRMEAATGFAPGAAARCTRIEDRNGNFVAIGTDAATEVTTYTDELGRQTVVSWASPSVLTVTARGYSGVPDRVVSINTDRIGAADASGVLSNLRAEFRDASAYPRPFTSGDYQRNSDSNVEHTIQGPHTDLFLGSESADNIDEHYAVTKVDLPDGRPLRFRYNQYGEVAEIVYPAGGVSQLDYQGFQSSVCEGVASYTGTLDRRVTQRRLLTDGATVDATWGYAYGLGTVGGVSYPKATLTARAGAGGALLLSETHYFLALKAEYRTCHPRPSGDVATDGTAYERWDNAKEFRVERQTGAGTEVTVRQWEQRAQVAYLPEPNAAYTQEQPANDPRVAWEETTLEDGRKRRVEYTYDDFNNVTAEKEYDFGDTSGTTGTLLRQTLRTYASSLNGYCYTNLNGADGTCGGGIAADLSAIIHQRRLMLTQAVKYGEGTDKLEAFAQFEYDNYTADGNHAALQINAGMTGYSGARFANFAAAAEPRGNLTKQSAWIEGGTYAETPSPHIDGGTFSIGYSRYDNAGNVISVKDPLQHVSTVSYADDLGDGSNPGGAAQGPAGPTYAFPTAATNALGQQAKTQYDYARGVPTGTRDANGVVSKTEYDSLGRPVRALAALGLAEQAISEMSYPSPAENAARVSRQLDSTRWLAAKTEFDGFGRAVRSASAEDGQHASTAGFTIFAKTVYDGLGRSVLATNPYRAQSASTDGWTRTTYDLAGRVTEVATFAGGVSSPPPDTGTNGNWTGSVVTTYAGAQTTVRDQANKQRRSTVDGLGRLALVEEMYEYPSTSVYSPTSYEYDARGNLKRVVQGAQGQAQQERTFTYDGLSRLKSAKNPETRLATDESQPGTVTYTYDLAGNLKAKTDPRGVTVNYDYDELNRVKTRTYTDSTPAVTYTYDTGGANSVGQLTSVSSSVSTTAYGAFDTLGRVKQSSQTTEGVTYTFQDYSYDLAGDLISETYPSGRVVKTEYDAAGRLAGVRNGAVGAFYAGDGADQANRAAYTAAGGVTSLRLGNGLWEHTTFNSRVQPVQIGLGNTSTDSSKLQLDYSYGTTNNNGNVQSQMITAAGLILQQSYDYDQVNRLSSAREVGGGAETWKQVYSYDVFGNRRFGAGTTSPAVPQGQEEPTANPTISVATNRITSAGYIYDPAGNLTSKPGFLYAYDAENRMASADSGQPLGHSAYSYDGDGRRVKKVTGSNSVTTVFVYDAAGRLAAEYGSAPAQPNGTLYLTQDTLGSTRVVTDAQQNADSNNGHKGGRHDYFPFGEEVGAGVGGRTTGQGYSQLDGNQKKWAKLERDNETGLDYAQARYYSSTLGRFTSPDEFTGGPDELFVFVDDAANNPTFYADLREPQSLNKYQYAYNNPLRYIDPNGHEPDDPDPDPQGQSGAQRIQVPAPPIRPLTKQEVEDLKAAGRAISDGFDQAAAAARPYLVKALAATVVSIIKVEQATGLLPSPPATSSQTGTPAQISSPVQTGTPVLQPQIQPVPPPPPIQNRRGRGGKRNVRQTQFEGQTTAQLQDQLKTATGELKRKILQELKHRQERNKQKRGSRGY